MSLTLRFAKEYKVEMSSNTFGNYDNECIERLLMDCEEGDPNSDREIYFDENSNNFEVRKKYLVRVIKWVENMSDDEYNEYGISETKENLVAFFNDALENSEPSIDYVKFEWA